MTRAVDVDRGHALEPQPCQGPDAAVHGHRHIRRQLDPEPDQSGDLGLGHASVATITSAGLAAGAATGTSTISATLNGVSGSTVLTVTAAVVGFDRRDAGQPDVAKGLTAAVHGDRHLFRQLDAEPDRSGDLGLGHASVATITSAGLATGVATGTATITATLNGVSGSTVLTVTAPLLVSIAVTPANPSLAKGLTQQFTATGTYSDNSTQNLTSQVTWSSATPSSPRSPPPVWPRAWRWARQRSRRL